MERKAHIDFLIGKYSQGLPTPIFPQISNGGHHKEHIVLLTGSTGSLGSEILALLLDSKVTKVYAFNRSSRGPPVRTRHHAKFAAKGLDTGLLQSTKLIFLEGDASLPNIGLSENLYEELRASVTIIIHNAWPINLTRPLASFEANISGTRNLLDMALASPHSSTLRFLFISSLTAAQSWDRGKGHVPEEVLTDSNTGVGYGYGESKFVAEQIVSRSGLCATTLRIGQICGRLANGAWSTTEWVAILIKSGFELGALPSAMGVVSWLPLDVVAKCTLDVAFSKEQPPPVLNLWHPRPVPWNDLMGAVGSALSRQAGRRIPLVTFSEWVSILDQRARNPSTRDLQKIPGIKLLDSVFRQRAVEDVAITESGRTDVEHLGLNTYATQKARVFSPTLRDLQPISATNAEQWVSYWCQLGFIGSTPVLARL